MKSLSKKYQLLLLFLSIKLIISSVEDDLVKSIPDYEYRGRLYSGYLDVSDTKNSIICLIMPMRTGKINL